MNDPSSTAILGNLALSFKHETRNPASREVLVKIHAAALNYRDLLILAHSESYPVEKPDGLVPCADGAGEVVQVGHDVQKWSVGDKVLFSPQFAWLDEEDVSVFDFSQTLGVGEFSGTLQQYLIVSEDWIVKMPDHLSYEEAAALPLAGSTAVNALLGTNGLDSWKTLEGKLKSRTVLTQGTGGVSCFAIQLASALGMTVYATSSSDVKLSKVRELGANHTINYHDFPNWHEEVLRLTENRGVDLVVEVGGAGTLKQSLRAARQGGTVALVGILTQSKPQDEDLVPDILFGAKTIRGVFGFSIRMLQILVEIVVTHDIKPVISQVFDWRDAPGAFAALQKGNTIGKIVVRM